MENVRKSPGYAESQIRLILTELSNSSHTIRLKGVKNFQTYIETYTPEVYDDDVDFLYTGFNNESNTYTTQGLLHYSGAASEKHEGQLKRICQPTIGLVKWLVSFKGYNESNIFYDRFVQLSTADLVKINFCKHILQASSKQQLTENRSGSVTDALELLSYLVRDHRNSNGEPDPIEINQLIDNNKSCKDKFLKYLATAHQSSDALNTSLLLENISNKKILQTIRPKKWADVVLKPVPLQEDELGVLEVLDEGPTDGKAPVPDPLGLQDVDLRVVQEFHESLVKKQQSVELGARRLSAVSAHLQSAVSEETKEGEQPVQQDSLVPVDKNFSPSLFLSYVHGNALFTDLAAGSTHLESLLAQQSSRRVNIVREHFGLFVLCAEGLEMLKHVRSSGAFSSTASVDSADGVALKSVDPINQRLSKSQDRLDTAKLEAESALAPLLQRHKRSKEIKKAEQELRNIAAVIEVPHLMQRAFASGQYEEVVATYARVVKMSRAQESIASESTASATIVRKVKEKVDGIMEELKKKCEEAMRQTGRAPVVSSIMRYWKVLCSFEAASEAREVDVNVQLQYLRSTFEEYMSQLVQVFKKVLDELRPAAAQALIAGQGAPMVAEGGASTSSRPAVTKQVFEGAGGGAESRRRRADYDEDSESSDECTDVMRDDDETDFEGDLAGRAGSSAGERNMDACRRLCFDVRLNALKRVVDLGEAWLPSMHELALTLTDLTQTATATKTVGRRGHAGTSKTPVLTVFAKELLKLSQFCSGLVKGMSASVGGSDGALGHVNFSSPLTSRYASTAFEEIFCLYELISNLQTTSIASLNAAEASTPSSANNTPVPPISKSPYTDAVSLLEEISVEGELQAAASVMAQYDHKVTTILATLERGMGATVDEMSKPSQSPSLVMKSATDFELLCIRTFRKIVSNSNRPDWVLEVFKEGVLLGFQKLVRCLRKILLESDLDDFSSLSSALESRDVFEFDFIESLLGYSRGKLEAKSINNLLESIRVCIYLQLLVIPKITQDISDHFDLQRASSKPSNMANRRPSSTDSELVWNVKTGIANDTSELISALETSLLCYFLELRSYSIRNSVSTVYYNLLSRYDAKQNKAADELPLLAVLLQLTEERERIDAAFSTGLLLYTDSQDAQRRQMSDCPAPRVVSVVGFGQILFSELCKQISAFYVDLVAGLYTGSVYAVIDVNPSAGIVLPVWNKKEIILSPRGTEQPKFLLRRASNRSLKAVGSVPSCPWPLLFQHALRESIYIGRLTKSIVDGVDKNFQEWSAKSFPVSHVQFQVDMDAYAGSRQSNVEDSLNERLKSLALLLT